MPVHSGNNSSTMGIRCNSSDECVSLKGIWSEEESEHDDRSQKQVEHQIVQKIQIQPQSPGRFQWWPWTISRGASSDSTPLTSPRVTVHTPRSHAEMAGDGEMPHRVKLVHRMRVRARKAEVASGVTVGNGARQHYAVYIVECNIPYKGCVHGVVWRVARRYSDFWRLRSDLLALEKKRAWRGLLAPDAPRLQQVPFPPKRWWGNASHETMAHRLPLLHRFIQIACSLVAGEGEAFLLDQFLKISENNRPPCASDRHRKRYKRPRAPATGTFGAHGSGSKPRSSSLDGWAALGGALPSIPQRRPSGASDTELH